MIHLLPLRCCPISDCPLAHQIDPSLAADDVPLRLILRQEIYLPSTYKSICLPIGFNSRHITSHARYCEPSTAPAPGVCQALTRRISNLSDGAFVRSFYYHAEWRREEKAVDLITFIDKCG